MVIRSRLYYGASVLFVCLTYAYLNSRQYTWYLKETKKCQRDQENLKILTADVHHVLESFHLTHFLVYGR